MNDGLFWSARLSNGVIEFYRSESATQGAAELYDSGISVKYLKLEDNLVRKMTIEEMTAVDLAEQADAAQRQEQAEQEQARVEQEQAAARLTWFTSLIPSAVIFRATLRKHFGDNAETNTEVTAKAVQSYFAAKQLNGTITAVEVADAVMLDKLYAELVQYTGDGTTWSFPWAELP